MAIITLSTDPACPWHLQMIHIANDGVSPAWILTESLVLEITFAWGAKTETKSGILCEIYGMSDRLATSPGGGRWHTGGGAWGGAQLDMRQASQPAASSGRVINEQVAASGFMWQLVSCSSHPHYIYSWRLMSDGRLQESMLTKPNNLWWWIF